MSIRNYSGQNAWVGVVVGLIFMVFPIFLFLHDDSVKKNMDSQVMSSSVSHETEYSSRRKGSSTTLYRPIYKYEVNNRVYTCSSRMASSFKSYDNQIIYYQSYNPQDCIVETTKKDIGFYAVFFLMGLLGVLSPFFKTR